MGAPNRAAPGSVPASGECSHSLARAADGSPVPRSYQVADGRIVNAWINWDWLAIMEAIGAVSWNEAAKEVGATVKRHP